MDPRAGTPAQPSDLIDVDAVVGAYYDLAPDVDDPAQKVVFGTSGHRGSSLDHAFNEAHIIAITAAIVEYRRSQGTDGPLFIGRDTHALSLPAWQTALDNCNGYARGDAAATAQVTKSADRAQRRTRAFLVGESPVVVLSKACYTAEDLAAARAKGK